MQATSSSNLPEESCHSPETYRDFRSKRADGLYGVCACGPICSKVWYLIIIARLSMTMALIGLVFCRASLMANCLVTDYEQCRETCDEDGYYELSVSEHKTSDTGGPLTVYLDTEVSLIINTQYFIYTKQRCVWPCFTDDEVARSIQEVCEIFPDYSE